MEKKVGTSGVQSSHSSGVPTGFAGVQGWDTEEHGFAQKWGR